MQTTIRKFGAGRPGGDHGSARATRLLYGSVGKGGATGQAVIRRAYARAMGEVPSVIHSSSLHACKDGSAYEFRYLRNYGVSEGLKSVCPIGNPISHSTHVGFSIPFTVDTTCKSMSCLPRAIRFWIAPLRKQPRSRVSDACGVGQYFTAAGSPLRGSFAMLPRFSASFARGVGQYAAASCNRACTFAPFGLGLPSHERAASVRQGVLSLLDALGVGHNPHSVTPVMGANGGSWNAVPLCIKPERGQVSENCSKPSTKQCCDVLHDNELGSKFASKTGDFRPKPTALACQPSSVSGARNILAREPSADDIDGNSIGSKSCGGEFSNVMIARHLRPVFRQHAAGEFLNLAEGDRFETARAFKAKAKAANARKEIEDAQLVHADVSSPTPFVIIRRGDCRPGELSALSDSIAAMACTTAGLRQGGIFPVVTQ